jgi:glycosyltransferase involved in cell wall biosynthesis
MKKTIIISTAPSSMTGGALIHSSLLKYFAKQFSCKCYYVGFDTPVDRTSESKKYIGYSFPSFDSENSNSIQGVLKYYAIISEIIDIATRYKSKRYSIVLFASFIHPFGDITTKAADILRSKRISCKTLLLPTGSDVWKIGSRFKSITKEIIENSSIVFTYSCRFSKEIVRKIQCRKNIYVIPPIINTDFFKPTSPNKQKKIREELRISEEDIVLCHISNLRYVKGIYNTFQIANAIARRTNLKVILMVVGPISQHLSELIVHKMKLAGNQTETYREYMSDKVTIRLLGEKKNVLAYLQVSNLAINTSYHDSFNTSIAEAMACGVPIITSDIAGILDYSPPSSSVIVFTYKNLKEERLTRGDLIILKKSVVEDVARKAMAILCDQKKQLLIRDNNRNFILNNFTGNVLRQKYLTLLNSVI